MMKFAGYHDIPRRYLKFVLKIVITWRYYGRDKYLPTNGHEGVSQNH